MMKKRMLEIIICICLLMGVYAAGSEKTTEQSQEGKETKEEEVKEKTEEGEAKAKTEEEEAIANTEEKSAGDGTDNMEAPFPIIPYASAYRNFLETYLEENENAHEARAMLALIDDDNLPELLLIEDNSHASGVKVYTYFQESVVELGEFGSMGSMQYVERGGMILSSFTGMGESSDNFFRVENGAATPVCALMAYQPSDGRPAIYEIDGAGATREAYHKKWEELYNTDEYAVIGYEDAWAMSDLEPEDLIAKAVNALLFHRESSRLEELVWEQAEVLEGYGMFLADYMSRRKGSDNGNGEEVPGFALTYLDGDDVPELIVIEGYAHACGAAFYTFEQGEVIPIGVYGQYGAVGFQEKNGIVFDDYDTGGNTYSNVYRIEGSRAAVLQSYGERCDFSKEGEEPQYTYTVDGKAVSEEQYREVYEKWNDTGCRVIDYGMCRTLTDEDIQKALTEELKNLILTQEEALKQNVLIAAGAQESKILLLDYDDYDRDGKCEVFMLCGDSYEEYGAEKYRGQLYFAGADCCMRLRNQAYRMIDGKMILGLNRKYLFFYTDFCFTANISELWTVEDGKPVECEFSQMGQVVYRGGNEFEIWLDAYDHFYETEDDLWTGHTYKPYFCYYDYNSNRIEAYQGEEISGETFEEISGTNLLKEIEAEGYTVGTIIRWENEIVTINYEENGEDDFGVVIYENIIWDNRAGDFWRKEERGVTSWKDAGEGGSFGVEDFENKTGKMFF